jgi:hypothetical protein
MENINQICSHCGGTGLLPSGGLAEPQACILCNGTGKVLLGELDLGSMVNDIDWIKKKIKKILTKLDVPE